MWLIIAITFMLCGWLFAMALVSVGGNSDQKE
jgi:hypothetical protein